MPSTMTVDDLLVKVRDAYSKMSRKNAHRLVLAQCHDALIELATRIEGVYAVKETPNAPTDA